MPILRRVAYFADRPGTIRYRLPHLGQRQAVKCLTSTLRNTCCAYIMGAVWSSYAGSTDTELFATPENEEEVREYDYIICGGKLGGLSWDIAYISRWNCWLRDC